MHWVCQIHAYGTHACVRAWVWVWVLTLNSMLYNTWSHLSTFGVLQEPVVVDVEEGVQMLHRRMHAADLFQEKQRVLKVFAAPRQSKAIITSPASADDELFARCQEARVSRQYDTRKALLVLW